MKKIIISLVTLVLVFTGAQMLFAAGDLLVTGNIGVGTATPDQKLVSEEHRQCYLGFLKRA